MTSEQKNKMNKVMRTLREMGANSVVIAESVLTYEKIDKHLKILEENQNLTLKEYLEMTGIEEE